MYFRQAKCATAALALPMPWDRGINQKTVGNKPFHHSAVLTARVGFMVGDISRAVKLAHSFSRWFPHV